MLGKVLKKNNFPHIRWHDLRQSCAIMLLIEMGWTPKEVSDWLGHSSTYDTENIYSHITKEHKNKRGAELNGLLIG